MKLSFDLALVSLAAAVPLVAAQTIQSKSFKLIAYPQGSSNGTSLQTCHIGAGIESLCVGSVQTTFHLNTTKGTTSPLKGDGVPGTLTYLLPTEPPLSQGMTFYADISTNVATVTFGLGNPVSVSFDRDGLMNVISDYNDLVTPPAEKTVAYYRWYICKTSFEGHLFTNIAWLYGKSPPQNPSCQMASVKRVFV